MVLCKISSRIEEQNISILKLKLVVLCLISDIRQSLHKLPGEMELLNYKTKHMEPFWECSYLIPLKNDLFKCFSLLMLTNFNQCPLYIIQPLKSFSIRNRMFHWISFNYFSKQLSWRHCAKQFRFTTSFKLSIHCYQSFVSLSFVETNFHLVFRHWNSNAAIFSKVFQNILEKQVILRVRCNTRPIFMNHYP